VGSSFIVTIINKVLLFNLLIFKEFDNALLKTLTVNSYLLL